MAAREADFFDGFKDENYDDFFSENPKPTKMSSSHCKEQSGPACFAMDDGDDDDAEVISADAESSTYDCRVPEMPEAPGDFSGSDLRLRDVLGDFYLRFRADNIANVNRIVEQYRGSNLTHLCASLAIKYNLPTHEAVDMLSQCLYVSSPFEWPADLQAKRSEELRTIEGIVGDGIENSCVREELLGTAMEACNQETSYCLLQMLCFRGIRTDEFRPRAWKLLLGYLPKHQHDEWNAIQCDKKSLYESHKARFLAVNNREKLEVKATERPLSECIEILSQIQKDVARTRQEVQHFQRQATQISLMSILYVYAQMNPDLGYAQGMNEVAAVILYVMSADLEFAESDAFWCFSALMSDIKPGFMTEACHTGGGFHHLVDSLERLLRRYDPELARHLHRCGSPQFVLVFRWCAVLFAQDATLPDVLRLWDSFIADPRRYELVARVSLAAMLGCRDQLLSTSDDFELAEVLRHAPQRAGVEDLLRRSWAILAMERRAQTPVFPVKSAAELAEQFSDWAQGAASKAQGFAQSLAPVMKEGASKASSGYTVARDVTKEKAQAVQTWLEEAAPVRREALDQAKSRFSSLLSATGNVATLAAKKFVETM